MENFGIDTTQNVNVDYKMAGLFERIIAVLVDSIIIIGYYLLLLLLLGIELFDTFFILALILPVIVYDLVFEIFANGQTPGKMAMKIRVMRQDGTTPSIVSYLLRWALRLVEISATMGSVAIISIIVSKKGQRLGDMAAGTIVVKLESGYNIDDTMLVDTGEEENILLPDVVMLNDDEINLVREVLRNADKRHDNPQFAEKMEQLRSYFEDKLGTIEGKDTVQYLQRILVDYNQAHKL